MDDKSQAIFVNPKRGKSMNNFITKIFNSGFKVEYINFNNEQFKQG